VRTLTEAIQAMRGGQVAATDGTAVGLGRSLDEYLDCPSKDVRDLMQALGRFVVDVARDISGAKV
jgi:hypothetical protein